MYFSCLYDGHCEKDTERDVERDRHQVFSNRWTYCINDEIHHQQYDGIKYGVPFLVVRPSRQSQINKDDREGGGSNSDDSQ